MPETRGSEMIMSNSGRTYYDVLGVLTDASCKEIDEAFRDIMWRLHPNSSKRTVYCDEVVGLMCEAQDTLSNPERRAAYDKDISYGQMLDSADIGPQNVVNLFLRGIHALQRNQAA